MFSLTDRGGTDGETFWLSLPDETLVGGGLSNIDPADSNGTSGEEPRCQVFEMDSDFETISD